MKAKELTCCGMLTSLIIALEVVASQFGEALVIITVFSALPVFILTKKNIKWGLLSYSVVTVLLSIINFHQMLFFIFTNGLIGICLGVSCNLKIKKCCAPVIAAVFTTGGMNILSIILGINFFNFFGSYILLNELIICILLVIYCSLYLWGADKIYKHIEKYFNV